MHLRPLEIADIPMMARHQQRHSRENRPELIFTPNEGEYTPSADDQAKMAEALAKPVTSLGWTRTWIITDETEIYGEVTLSHRPALKAALHRALLFMGVEKDYRDQGWGSRLMSAAIAWAKEQPSLEWFSLHVFDHNDRAKALYRKFGFVPSGTTKDVFRVFGQSIDNTSMDLKLR